MHPHIHAKDNPEKPAYIMANSGEVVTYKQLNERSNQIANFFRERNLKPGDHIAIFLENKFVCIKKNFQMNIIINN